MKTRATAIRTPTEAPTIRPVVSSSGGSDGGAGGSEGGDGGDGGGGGGDGGGGEGEGGGGEGGEGGGGVLAGGEGGGGEGGGSGGDRATAASPRRAVIRDEADDHVLLTASYRSTELTLPQQGAHPPTA